MALKKIHAKQTREKVSRFEDLKIEPNDNKLSLSFYIMFKIGPFGSNVRAKIEATMGNGASGAKIVDCKVLGLVRKDKVKE